MARKLIIEPRQKTVAVPRIMPMTEAEWNACTDPIQMIEFLRGNPRSRDAVTWWNSGWRLDGAAKGNDRKFRLFACACCRRIWDRIPEQCNREAVVAVENFLEGCLPAAALEEALSASSRVEYTVEGMKRSEPGYWTVKYLGRGFYKMTAAASALLVASQVMFMADEEYARLARGEFLSCYYAGEGYFLRPFQWPLPVPSSLSVEGTAQAAMLRCVFGPCRFRPVSTDPAWLTQTATGLAESIYEERAFDRLPILADALEYAGCTQQDILVHFRRGGEHHRGCWPLDMILGID
jgi:hypothetical protein